jgi:hypothetical protein
MPILNPFTGSAYSMANLTLAINKMPNMYTLLGDMGLFTEEGITTRVAIIEQRNNVLNLLPIMPVGARPSAGTIGKREARAFVIPHIPHADVVLPSEVQGIRAFGSESETETIQSLMFQKLQTMKNKHAITKEWLRAGALNGIVYDSDGTTVVYNYFTEFGITRETVNLALTDLDLEVRNSVMTAKRWIETHLYGETSNGFMALCSPEFFDALVAHPVVKEAYKFYQQQQNLSGDFRGGFRYGDVIWKEYLGQATDVSGNVRKFITANEALMFPLGTTQMFRMYYAPGNFNSTVNTVGLPLYALQEERDMQQGWDILTESNPLPVVTRPEAIVRLTIS